METKGRHRVHSLVARPAVYVHANDSLRRLATTLTEEAIGAALVRGPHGGSIGLVSERDIVTALSEGADPDRTRVDEVMAEDLVTVAPSDDVLDAVHVMLDAEVRHLPVVEDGVAFGMVSVRDALKILANDGEAAEA